MRSYSGDGMQVDFFFFTLYYIALIDFVSQSNFTSIIVAVILDFSSEL